MQTKPSSLPSGAAPKSSSPVYQLIRRLHFYAGLFISPFIFIAALSGAAYVLTPQLEDIIYSDLLNGSQIGDHHPLSAQITAASDAMDDSDRISAVRPAPHSGGTTRVMFSGPAYGPSESLAVFVDPVTLEIKGKERVYGTSGVLPLRAAIDHFHANLMLGEPGRLYSETAASWLWFISLGGLILWAVPRWKNRKRKSSRPPVPRRIHTACGLTFLIVFMFLSATGLTWSTWAGENIAQLRLHMGWMTPSLKTSLEGNPVIAIADEHAHHRTSEPGSFGSDVEVYPALFDWVLKSARTAGIDAAKIEIRPSWKIKTAWTVAETDRSWPTQVDSVAIDPKTFTVTDHVRFSDYGLLARLTRWGIDAHMGILFGIANQLLMAGAALALCSLIVTGYTMWWRRRPRHGLMSSSSQSLRATFKRLSITGRVTLIAGFLIMSFCLPLMGVSLMFLLIIDYICWLRIQRTQDSVTLSGCIPEEKPHSEA